jgi:hypothetical protein
MVFSYSTKVGHLQSNEGEVALLETNQRVDLYTRVDVVAEIH